MRKTILSIGAPCALAASLVAMAAAAQNQSLPSSDWNSNWRWSPTRQALQLQMADLIEKKEGGFYDEFSNDTIIQGDFISGDQLINNGSIGTLDQSETTTTNTETKNVADKIDIHTSTSQTIGAINTTTQTIGDNVILNDTIINSEANASESCQNGSINIASESSSNGSSGSTCP